MPFRVDEEIRADEVLLFDERRQRVGVVPTPDAVQRARSVGLRLVEIDALSRPPTCRILDLEAFLRTREGRRSVRMATRRGRGSPRSKELRVRPTIDEHGLERLLERARRLLTSGHEVRVVCVFRASEMAHPERGAAVLRRVARALADVSHVAGPPVLVGRRVLLRLAPRT
jgi:translation initiation factor IF-3